MHARKFNLISTVSHTQYDSLFIHIKFATINICTFGRSFKEWKFYKFEMEALQQKIWMECPPSTISQYSGHVDGNMKLYRFRSAGGY